ncbi:GOLPH3/VPS74 family protein [Sphaerisporangium aureirubrum]|uniref:GPP34 family phosphoprotein n=1 Tax=Sphaerisporangium aureirubrum TaxID=1544736 RepID=A0ABW1NTD5_9ACTN
MDLPKSLPERLYLLSYDIERRRLTNRSRLGYLMRAGILAELLIQGHIADATGGPEARAQVLADPMLDEVLQQIASSRRRSWQHWVGKRHRQALTQVRDRLEKDRRIRVERNHFLGIFPWTRVTVRDTRVVRSLLTTVSSGVRGGTPVARIDRRDAALVALAAKSRLRAGLSRSDWRAARSRVDALGETVAPIPRALHKTIEAAEASAG